MERNLDDRAYELAVYMLEHNATVRAAAAKFGVSKSTVHMAVTITSGSYGVLNEKRPEDVVEKSLAEFAARMPRMQFN
jgi:putative DeoR family transcriptional regulator (stage III sporulation protein D)